MRGDLRFLLLFVGFLFLALGQRAYGCDLKDNKEKVVVRLTEDRGYCKDISISFPKELPSRESWVYGDPYVRFKVVKNGQSVIEAFLQISHPDEKGYLETSFCLASDVISSTVVDIEYEEISTERPA